MLTHPLDNLLDGYFLVGAFVILLAWFMATAMTDDLLAMALQPDDIYMTRTFTDRWQDTARPVYTDRAGILRRFVARWVVGGVLLVILAAGSRFAMPENGLFAILRQNIDPTVVAAIIVYFLLGLVLVSQGQIALLRARWALQKTPSTQSVLRNWPFYALLLIVIIGIIAALLPLGGTFRLAQIIHGCHSGHLFWPVRHIPIYHGPFPPADCTPHRRTAGRGAPAPGTSTTDDARGAAPATF